MSEGDVTPIVREAIPATRVLPPPIYFNAAAVLGPVGSINPPLETQRALWLVGNDPSLEIPAARPLSDEERPELAKHLLRMICRTHPNLSDYKVLRSKMRIGDPIAPCTSREMLTHVRRLGNGSILEEALLGASTHEKRYLSRNAVTEGCMVSEHVAGCLFCELLVMCAKLGKEQHVRLLFEPVDQLARSYFAAKSFFLDRSKIRV